MIIAGLHLFAKTLDPPHLLSNSLSIQRRIGIGPGLSKRAGGGIAMVTKGQCQTTGQTVAKLWPLKDAYSEFF